MVIGRSIFFSLFIFLGSSISSLYSQPRCEIKDSLKFYFQQIANGQDSILYQRTYPLLKRNEINEDTNCYFPGDSLENKLLYNALNTIKFRSNSDENALEFIIKYKLLFLKNVELSESLMYMIPYLAINNTKSFLIALQKLESGDKNRILDDLEYLKGIDEVNLFENNLKNISGKDLQEIKKEVIQKLEELKQE